MRHANGTQNPGRISEHCDIMWVTVVIYTRTVRSIYIVLSYIMYKLLYFVATPISMCDTYIIFENGIDVLYTVYIYLKMYFKHFFILLLLSSLYVWKCCLRLYHCQLHCIAASDSPSGILLWCIRNECFLWWGAMLRNSIVYSDRLVTYSFH